ncbi:MAG: competence/damage-inducible protein A [Gemmatimonadota bacterium]
MVMVGEELLSGETVDTNAAWLGRELAAMGIPVRVRRTVGDVDADIRRAVAASLPEADVVLIGGGLGPTRDDVTREAVAGQLGLPLDEDEELIAGLEARFRSFGHDRMPASNRSQALVPRGARVLANRHGSAPGLALEAEGSLVVLLPGVPREVRGLFEDEVRGLLRDRFGARLEPVRHRVLHTTGVSESLLAELVDEVLPPDGDRSRVAFLPDALGVELRLTVSGVAQHAVNDELDRLEALLAPVIEPWRYDSDSGDLAEAVARGLRRLGATVAIAESCTGGLVAHRLTRVPGVSDVLLGGVVAYANAVKRDTLGVAQDDLERHGAVSEPVARAMASGAARVLGADFGIGVTGIAGPGGGSDEKPVGTVWTAVSYGGDVQAWRRLFPGDRAGIQARAAQDALRQLDRALARVTEG